MKTAPGITEELRGKTQTRLITRVKTREQKKYKN